MTRPAEPTEPDPSAALVALYAAAAERLRGLPVYNGALRIEAVAFAPWQGHWLGVVVTPWFMNLTLTPCEPGRWVPLAVGAKRRLRFPAGDYEFIGAADPAFGEFQTCSLFSPMQDFADHETARLVASLARDALLDAAHAEAGAPVTAVNAAIDRRAGAAVSKRDFLRGRLGGGAADGTA